MKAPLPVPRNDFHAQEHRLFAPQNKKQFSTALVSRTFVPANKGIPNLVRRNTPNIWLDFFSNLGHKYRATQTSQRPEGNMRIKASELPTQNMKTHTLRSSGSLALLAGFLAFNPCQQASAQSESDDFTDGNDVGWERYDTIGSHPAFPEQGTWTFPNGGYRLQAAASPAPGVVGPARIGSVRPGVYSDFYVAVDVTNWDDSLDQSFGPFARLSDLALGSTKGYVMTYQARGKDIDITRITGEAAERSVRQNGSGDVTLVPGKSYRFAFIGKGALLIARVYELPDMATPIVEISGTDTEPYTSGINGLLVYDNSNAASSPADATFDNYFATDVEPPKLTIGNPDFFGAWQITWPAEASAFVLETSTVLPGTAADWTAVPLADIIPPSISNPIYIYNVVAWLEFGGLPQQFFRLVRPEPVPQ